MPVLLQSESRARDVLQGSLFQLLKWIVYLNPSWSSSIVQRVSIACQFNMLNMKYYVRGWECS